MERVSRGMMEAVVSWGLPRVGRSKEYPFSVQSFFGTVKMIAWAKENRCPLSARLCSEAANGGHLKVLRWARGNGCPWDMTTCDSAAAGGHLEVLKWARDRDCPWSEWTCMRAAEGGHLC